MTVNDNSACLKEVIVRPEPHVNLRPAGWTAFIPCACSCASAATEVGLTGAAVEVMKLCNEQ